MSASQDSPVPGQKTRQVWTSEEDRLLSEAVARETPKHGPISWHKVASHIPGRNNKDCRKRWHYSIANTIRKGTWTREEDDKLREAVEVYGARWSKIAEAVGSRNGDQCWKRWYDCLDPRIDKSPWTAEEDARLLHLVSQTGRNWSDIVHQNFPNRTSLAAKNRYTILLRKQENSGGSSSISRSSSARHARSAAGAVAAAAAAARSAASTPSLSSSPYLGVATTPLSFTALSTPEPEFAPAMGQDWMGLSETEIDELLSQGMGVDEEWFTSPQIGGVLDPSFGPPGWMATGADSSQQHWSQQQTSFDCSPVDSQTQTGSEDVGYGGYYGQCQQMQAPGYGYNMLGVYQGEAQAQMPYQGTYATSGGLVAQSRENWQAGYNTAGW